MVYIYLYLVLLCITCISVNAAVPLTLWHPLGSDFTNLVQTFLQQQAPKYNVTIEEHNWSVLLGDLESVRLAGNSQPDIVVFGSTWSGSFIRKKMLVPLTKYFMSWRLLRQGGDITRDIVKGPEYDYLYNEDWYALPFSLDVRLLYYRPDLYLTALGHDRPPSSWMELVNNSVTIQNYYLNNYNVSYYGMPASNVASSQNTMQEFLPLAWSFGASILTQDYACNLNSSEFKQALSLFKDMKFRYNMNPTTNADVQMLDGSPERNWIHFCSGTWDFSRMNDTSNGNVGMALVPSGPAGRFGLLGGSAVGLMSWSLYPDDAWQFMSDAFDPEKPLFSDLIIQLEFLPAYQSMSDIITNNTLLMKAQMNAPYSVVQQYPNMDFIDFGFIEANETVSRLVNTVLFGNMTIDQAADQACVELLQVLHPALQCEPACEADYYCMVVDATDPWAAGQCIEIQSVKPEGSVIAVIVLAAVGLLVTLISAVIIGMGRSSEMMRMSNPVVTETIALGLSLLYCYVIVLSLRPSNSSCEAQLWLLLVPVGLVLGAILAKSFLIYLIMNNSVLHSTKLSTRAVFQHLSIFVLIEVLLVLIGTLVDPSLPVLLVSTESQTAEKICKNSNDSFQSVFRGVIITYHVFLFLATMFMTFKTQNVASKYREGNYMSLSVNNAALTFLVLIGLVFGVGSSQSSIYYIKAIGVLYATSFMSLCLVWSKFYFIMKHEKFGNSNGSKQSQNASHYLPKKTMGQGETLVGMTTNMIVGAFMTPGKEETEKPLQNNVCVLAQGTFFQKWHNKILILYQSSCFLSMVSSRAPTDRQLSFATFCDDISIQNVVNKSRTSTFTLDLTVHSLARTFTIQFENDKDLITWKTALERAQQKLQNTAKAGLQTMV